MEIQNSVAKVLRIIGIVVMIGGFIIALVSGTSHGHWSLILPALFSSFVTGMIFIGFSEVIDLLHKIHLQLPQNNNSAIALSKNKDDVNQQQPQKDWQPSLQDLEDIQELYPGQKIRVQATPYEDYCIVHVEGKEHIEVVEIGGFKPKKITADSEPELFNKIQNWYNNLASS
ncbi:hypothetical protein [Mesobacillus jeotgali]|uniref:Uncharacterized protein n=1 Tax=Mesobacillus jeotgali TaxID=129985 RepID=A0ABY9VQ75_9BACI|nr:hypothetical protein [Mesobacillus jeotgali]WNF24891.1 hypothetical protein RH061_10570 [Mesobacillus jeotgali]